MSRRRAFTLVELLVVAALSAVVAGGSWQMLASGDRALEEAVARASALESAATAIRHVRLDLLGAAYVRPEPLDAQPALPVRIPEPSEIEIETLVPPAVLEGLAEIETAKVRYRFVPDGRSGHGLWRNGELVRGVELERFEAKLVRDPATGATFVRLAVTGVDPRRARVGATARASRAFVWDVIYLEQLENIRRHRSIVPNPVPLLRLGKSL